MSVLPARMRPPTPVDRKPKGLLTVGQRARRRGQAGLRHTRQAMRTVVERCAATAAVTLVLALLAIAFARFGADWPAQDFRAWVAQHGLSVWTNAWYGGSALPGYSVL